MDEDAECQKCFEVRCPSLDSCITDPEEFEALAPVVRRPKAETSAENGKKGGRPHKIGTEVLRQAARILFESARLQVEAGGDYLEARPMRLLAQELENKALRQEGGRS